MKKELDYFTIDGGLGWNQYWFSDKVMYYGGCAAVTACDLCIYLARQHALSDLYPYDGDNLTRNDYLAFSKTMKRYLGPRWKGVDRLELYTSGLQKYLSDVGMNSLEVLAVEGSVPWTEAKDLIQEQIDASLLVPFLLLHHKNRAFKAYDWHWFNLTGYEKLDGEFYVKAVTYGDFRWLNLRELWDTGHRRKGGFIRLLPSGKK